MSTNSSSETSTQSSTDRPIRFDPASFETAMRTWWSENRTYATPSLDDPDKKAYVLVMFPYPSGDGLHTGHARVYTGTDILARFYRMQGKSVLYPMGWDAFGLPAENAAMKKKTNPQELVPVNVANFKRQFDLLGMSFDWEKEINTTDPNYYAITQSLFITFFKHGLLYKKDTPVYYCPFCKTGLAQEEIEGDGKHERCGTQVEKRHLSQWIFRIQEYADSLLQGLEGLDWPKGILEMQKNWIGKKEGMNISYPVCNSDGEEIGESLTCFTTRPETQYGATCIVLAPEHRFAQRLVAGEVAISSKASHSDVCTYVETALRKTERERMAEEKTKTGVFTGYYAVNRLNGEKLPVWISDFVLVNVGSGAVVCVPAHDKRDFAFAAKFGLPVKRVIEGPDGNTSEITELSQVHEGAGTIMNSDFLDTMNSDVAYSEIEKFLSDKKYGNAETSYHLRDWIFSRQRYWGEPIPMVYCQACAQKGTSYWDTAHGEDVLLGLKDNPKKELFERLIGESKETMAGWFPLEVSELPLKLPHVDSYEPTESGASPLSEVSEWVHTTCPECGEGATRETDTMPNWAGSCWYYLAYPIAEKIRQGTVNLENPFEDIVQETMPVDWYIGGAEHAVLHLLYARFWMHVLHDLGSVTVREPFSRLRNVGMVQAEDGRKMSKSWGNVINPDDVIAEYGADALRVYEMFMAPFGQEIAWSTQTLQGAYRFIKRIWHIYHTPAKLAKDESDESPELVRELQTLADKIHRDITNVKFNTPISSMMEFLNSWEKEGKMLTQGHAKAFLQVLAPFAPYISDHLWLRVFGEKESIHRSLWPVVDGGSAGVVEIRLPIQVNGKVRDVIAVSGGIQESEALEKAMLSDKIRKWMPQSYRVVYIQDRILSIIETA